MIRVFSGPVVGGAADGQWVQNSEPHMCAGRPKSFSTWAPLNESVPKKSRLIVDQYFWERMSTPTYPDGRGFWRLESLSLDSAIELLLRGYRK